MKIKKEEPKNSTIKNLFLKEKEPAPPAQSLISGKDEKKPEAKDSAETAGDISPSLQENIRRIKAYFSEDETLIVREFKSRGDRPLQCAVCFLDGMCDSKTVAEFFIKAVAERTIDGTVSKNDLKKEIFFGGDFSDEDQFSSLVEDILSGNSVYFAEGFDFAFTADTKGFKKRSPEEPDNEKVLNGSREGFCEDIITNLALLRRRLRTNRMKIHFLKVGTNTNTKVAVCALDGVVDDKLYGQIVEKIQNIQIDGAVCTNYIEELICKNRISPFKIAGSTERPDTAAAKILEGKIAVVVDGTPMVMTVPYLFIENFISPDDYYLHYIYSSVMRMIRIACFFLSICLPGLFVALLTFHSQMMPTDFILSLIGAREGVPFPVIVESLGLLAVFEILRETGVRVSSAVGQPLSIVGALVLGDAAISAKYVSAPTVIIIAMACLSGLMLQKIKGVVVVYRILILFASAFLGLYGFLFAVSGMFFHLLTIKSFGVKYVGFSPITLPRSPRDLFVRLPFWVKKPNGQNKKNPIPPCG